MVPVSVAAIVNYFEKHALCSCSLSLSLSPLCFFILLLVTSLALEPPISCLASPRLASPRRCFFVLCELVLWFGPLERNGDASSIHARIYARRTFALSMLSQSRECNTRYMRRYACTRACAYTYTGIDTDAVMHREGDGRKRRISTETREKGDRGKRGEVDERIEGG